MSIRKRASDPGASWLCASGREFGAIAVLLVCASACASKVIPPALPAALKYAEFVYPAVPTTLQSSPVASAIDSGWRFLQNDDLGGAQKEFERALKQNRMFYPARAGEGYVALARRDYDKALAAFDAVLTSDMSYVPALVGRGQTLLGLKRDVEALAAFNRALAVDESLVDVRRRVEVLQFRSVQDLIERARSAAAAGRLDEARTAYERAIVTSPESSFLYRELGVLEHRQGDGDRALEHLAKAIDLDPADAAALIEAGGILEERQDFAAALANYRKASDLEPGAELSARIAAVAAKAREATLPAEFKAIPQSAAITRGELAALLGIRLEPLLRAGATRQEVVTDARNHWAAPWISLVLNAAVMDAFENHTFQPQTRIRRADLARAVSHALTLIARSRPDLQQKMNERPRVADMSTTHLDYPAVAVAVSTGVLSLTDGRFQVSRQVSGAEAIEAVSRLQMLADLR
jgi:tetratricopeptide (TPR) repeat protein